MAWLITETECSAEVGFICWKWQGKKAARQLVQERRTAAAFSDGGVRRLRVVDKEEHHEQKTYVLYLGIGDRGPSG